MLNPKTNERELAYVVRIDAIEPITGSDNCEAAVVGGWRVMTRKGTFKVGDLAIYFEIDSKVPETETFAFLEKKHYKIKTQKYTFGGKGNFVSQGLLMAPSDFGWEVQNGTIFTGKSVGKSANTGEVYYVLGDFLTKDLGVTYASAADMKRKSSSVDKYKKMAARHPKLFKNPIIKKIYKTNFGKKLLFIFFGKKKDKKGSWPAWVVKTDEERIQNLTGAIPEFRKEKWIATEKIDGTSTTFTMRGFGKKREFYICSRNVCFDKPDKNDKCYYDTNVYTEMAEKYNIEKVLADMLDSVKNDGVDFITIQGETYGSGVQKRDYSMNNERDFMAFNLIFGSNDGFTERANPKLMTTILNGYGIPCVPIVDEDFKMPETCDEILAAAAGASAIDGLPREGLVFRSLDGKRSFKAVDNGFLMSFHN